MRKLLILTAFVVLCAVSALAQQPSEVTGTISAAGADCSTATRCVVLSLGAANGTGLITVGTFTGTIAVEVSPDNSTWTTPLGGTTSITTSGSYFTSLQGARWLRVRSSTLSSGTPAIVLSATAAPFYGSVAVTGTAAVSAASLPLPTSASTSALQTTGNTSLSSIDGKVPALGQALAAASVPVILPSATITTLTPPAAITGFATAAKQPALGTAGASSTDVISVQGIASGTALPISAASLPLPSTAATSTKQSDGSQKTQVVDGSGNVIGATSNALDVNIKSGSSSGTQYTEDAAAAADPVGNAVVLVRKDTPSATVSADGDNIAQRGTNFGAAYVTLLDAAGSAVAVGGGTQYTQDAALTVGTSVGTMAMGRASAAVPTDVSADNDAVMPWYLRSGAAGVQPTFGGVLQSTGNGTAGTGTPRITIASDNTAFSVNAAGTKTNNNAAPGATNVGTIGFLANAAKPSWTEGNQVAGSVDLNGAIRATFLDSGGTTMTDTTAHAVKTLSVDAAGAAIVPTTLATHDGALTAASTTGGTPLLRASAAAPSAVSADDDAVLPWALRNGSQVVNLAAGSTLLTATSTSLNTAVTAALPAGANVIGHVIADTGSTTAVTGTVATTAVGTVAHDGVGTGAAPVLVGGYASAAAPTDVSADGDATRLWMLRNGSPVVNIAAAGALIGATSNALDVNIKSGSSSGTQYTEDAAAAADPVGNAVVLVRKDTPSATVSADGDNIAQRGTNFGAAYVTLLDAAGSAVAVGGGTQYTQDAALTVATSVGTMALGRASAAAPTNVSADDDAVMPWYLRSGAQAVQPTFAGVLSSTGTGAVGTGTARVAVGTDTATIAGSAPGTAGTASTNVLTVQGIASMTKLLVTPDSVALPANQSVNVNQLAGTTTDTNSGNKSAGTLRVVLATDQPALTNKLLVTPDSVALPANQSVNVSQVNGVTPLMGAGATGTGAQRTNGVSESATGAAPPAAATYVSGLGAGATGGFLVGIPVADGFQTVSITSATTTLLITGVSGRHVRISSLNLVTAIANNVALISGTGATCGTGTTGIAGGTTAANGWNFAANGGITLGSGVGTVIRTTATGDSVCAVTSANGPLAGTIAYTIY